MLKLLPIFIGCISIYTTSVMAQETLKTQKQKSSYVVGVEMGNQFILSKDDIDLDSMILGMKDVFDNANLKLNEDEMRSALMSFQDKEREREQVMLKKIALVNKAKGVEYIENNKDKKDVVTLESGLQYKVIKSGSGKIHPKRSDTVVTHYKGSLLDGTMFDNSYKRNNPITFPVNGVIKGWTEALLKMRTGDKWQLVIPSDLAYGDLGAPPRIAPGVTLIFEVELLEIK